MVVERLFELVQPNKAFFGLKDFQQVAVIKKMMEIRNLSVEIIPVDIVRSEKGLALSSRNALLSQKEKEDALIIFNTLLLGRSLAKKGISTSDALEKMKEFFSKGNLKLEYLTIVDEVELNYPKDFIQGTYCCIAAYCGEVRLIDNMRLA